LVMRGADGAKFKVFYEEIAEVRVRVHRELSPLEQFRRRYSRWRKTRPGPELVGRRVALYWEQPIDFGVLPPEVTEGFVEEVSEPGSSDGLRSYVIWADNGRKTGFIPYRTGRFE